MTRALTILVTAFTLAVVPAAHAGGQSCKVASDCKGMLPRVCRKCDDGKTQCAHHVCTKGTCEIATCPLTAGGAGSGSGTGGTGTGTGSGSGGTSSPQCTKASDCRGMLPHLCQKCANGQSDCAHWSCNQGSCEQEICPAPKPAPKASAR